MTAEERETVIQYNDADPLATVYTCHKAVANFLTRMKMRPESVVMNGARPLSWTFHVPKEWVKIRKPRRASTTPAALEARKAAGVRLKAQRSRVKSQTI